MPSSGSITQWIKELQEGEPDAATKIWRRYGSSLLGVARNRLGTTRRRVSDEEDVALLAFSQFCQGVKEDRFQKLENRDDLWHLLVMLTVRKSVDQVRRETRRRERGESVFSSPIEAKEGLGQVPSQESAPDIVAEALEQRDVLLNGLNDETLRQVAILKMEGFTNDEIAEKQDCASRTIERRLNSIRRKWASIVSVA